MKRVIPFTKFRGLAFVISLLMIVGGIGATFYFFKGFNLGMDFRGGYSAQIRIAPVAFTILNKSDRTIAFELSRDTVSYLKSGEDKKTYTLQESLTLGDLKRILEADGDLEVALAADPGLALSLLFPEKTEFEPNQQRILQYQPLAADKPRVDIDHLRGVLATITANPSLQYIGNPGDQEYMIRLGIEGLPITAEGNIDTDAISGIMIAGLEKQYGTGTVQVRSSEALSAQLAQTFASGSIIAVAVSLVLMLVYVTFRFRFNFAVAAVVALIHDALATVAFVGVFQVEFNTAVVAAVLTIIGFSINDTIVIYDRIRENETLMKGKNLALIMDTSVSQTLGRTFITSLTVFVAIFPLYLFGNGPVKDFSFAMVFGIIVGSYSSVFIAAPIILVWQNALNKAHRNKDMQLFGKSQQAEAGTLPAPDRMQELPAENLVALSEPHSGPVTRFQRVLDKKKKKKHHP